MLLLPFDKYSKKHVGAMWSPMAMPTHVESPGWKYLSMLIRCWRFYVFFFALLLGFALPYILLNPLMMFFMSSLSLSFAFVESFLARLAICFLIKKYFVFLSLFLFVFLDPFLWFSGDMNRCWTSV
jgi:hypothetical protein